MSYTAPVIELPSYAAPNTTMTPRSIATITDLIFHHTAGPVAQTALEIDAEHRAEGWAMIGYNFVIEANGMIAQGRPIPFVPSAAFGRNSESINVSLTGNFQSDDKGYSGPPTAAQIASSIALAEYLHKLYPSIVRTIGHRDVAPMFYPNDQGDYATACPGDKFYEQIPAIKSAVLSGMKAT